MNSSERIPGETVRAYVARQAELGGWPSYVSYSNQILGVPFRGVPTAEALADRLSEPHASVAFDTPCRVLGERSGPNILYRDQRLGPFSFVAEPVVRFCPDCVSEDLRGTRLGRSASWHRGWWDIAAVSTCHVHGTELLDRCDCGQAVHHRRPLSRHCTCGRFLGDATSRIWAADRRRGDRYVLGRLKVGEPLELPILDAAELANVIKACVTLGSVLAKSELGAPLNHGFDALSDWPASFHRALEKIGAANDGRIGRWGVAHHLGPLYRWLIKNKSVEPMRPIAAEVGKFADRNGLSPGRTVFGIECGNAGTMNLKAFSRHSGLSHKSAKRLLEERSALLGSTGSGQGAIIDVAVATEIIDALRDTITLTDLRAELGIGAKNAQRLVEKGLLKTSIADARRVGTKYVFHRKAGVDLLVRVRDALRPHRGNVTPLPQACLHRGLTLVMALDQVMAGTVRGRSLKGRGFDGLGVVVTDLIPGRVVRGRFTVNHLAKGLGIAWDQARVLVDAGLVPVDRNRAPTDDSIDRFNATYVAGSVVASGLGRSPRGCISFLKTKGVEPAIGPPVSRRVYYRRTDVEGALGGVPS